MSKPYDIMVARCVTETGWIYVNADSEEDAKKKAMQTIEDGADFSAVSREGPVDGEVSWFDVLEVRESRLTP